MKFSMTGQDKCVLLIQATAWAGLHIENILWCFIYLHLTRGESKCSRASSLDEGPGLAQWVRSLDLTAHTSLSPIRRGITPSFVCYKKWCTRLAAASDKVYQLLAQGRWFSPGTPDFSTTKTVRHDIAEILLKVALNSRNQSINRPLMAFEVE
jgi:hypothetical protein